MRINGIGKLSAIVTALLLAACGGDDGNGNAGVAAPVTSTANIKEVVSFGDSLNDVGTYNPTTADTDKTNDVFAGLPFTTKPGTTWASYLALQYGFFLQPYERVDFGVVGTTQGSGRVVVQGGTSYAQGGATVLNDAPNGGVTQTTVAPGVTVPVQLATALSVKTQIDTYVAARTAFNAHQLVLVDGGANDLINYLSAIAAGQAQPTQAAATAIIGPAATGMVTQLGRLAAAGATNIVYNNVPDLGLTPAFKNTALQAFATQITQGYNDAVKGGIAQAGLKVQLFDAYTMLQTIVAAPAQFGLTNVDQPACNSKDPSTGQLTSLLCSQSTLNAAGADATWVFADGVHPTNGMHKIWAGLVAAQIATAIPK